MAKVALVVLAVQVFASAATDVSLPPGSKVPLAIGFASGFVSDTPVLMTCGTQAVGEALQFETALEDFKKAIHPFNITEIEKSIQEIAAAAKGVSAAKEACEPLKNAAVLLLQALHQLHGPKDIMEHILDNLVADGDKIFAELAEGEKSFEAGSDFVGTGQEFGMAFRRMLVGEMNKPPGAGCKIGQPVQCPKSKVMCAGSECCPADGSTCPSADNSFTGCPHAKVYDCTTKPQPPIPGCRKSIYEGMAIGFLLDFTDLATCSADLKDDEGDAKKALQDLAEAILRLNLTAAVDAIEEFHHAMQEATGTLKDTCKTAIERTKTDDLDILKKLKAMHGLKDLAEHMLHNLLTDSEIFSDLQRAAVFHKNRDCMGAGREMGMAFRRTLVGPTPSPAKPTPAPPAPGAKCKVGQPVQCPKSKVMCAGSECCPGDGSTCPSADNSFTGCPHVKVYDCTTNAEDLLVV